MKSNLRKKIEKIIKKYVWGSINLHSDYEKATDKILSLISKELLKVMPKKKNIDDWNEQLTNKFYGYNQAIKEVKDAITKLIK
jgi:hypothetical protein